MGRFSYQRSSLLKIDELNFSPQKSEIAALLTHITSSKQHVVFASDSYSMLLLFLQASHSSTAWDQDKIQGNVSSTPTTRNSAERAADSSVTSLLHPRSVQQPSNELNVQLSQSTLSVSGSVSSSKFSDKLTAESLSLYL